MEQQKNDSAMKTIGETALLVGVEQHVLRFWEKKIPLIRPVKSRGRRYYRPSDVDLLVQIKELLYGQGYTIKGVVSYLKTQGSTLSTNDAQQNLFGENVGNRKYDAEAKEISQIISNLKNCRDQLAGIL